MSLELIVLDSTLATHQMKNLNLLYDFFIRSWNSTFKELGSSHINLQSEFSRFKVKVGIFENGKPIAFHGYHFFDLESKADRDHEYFKQFSEPVTDLLRAEGIRKAVSMEYMFVEKGYRKISGQPIGEVLGGFSTQYFRKSHQDAVLAVTRNDRGVDKMCLKYGARTLVENASLHGVEVNFMYFKPEEIKDNPADEVQSLINIFNRSLNKEVTYGVVA